MDIQFGGPSDVLDVNLENEYQLEIKINSVVLRQPSDVQLIFIFGDLVNKITCGDDEGFNDAKLVYTVHSTSSALSEKLSKSPIMLHVVSHQNSKALGRSQQFEKCF